MNLICPACQKTSTVSDQYAGQSVQCPNCGHSFVAPVLSAPAPAAVPTMVNPETGEDVFRLGPAPSTPPAPPPPPPPPRTPSASPPMAKLPKGALPPIPPATLLAGYSRVRTIAANPRIVPWIAPIGLVLVFLLLFFPWVVDRSHPETWQGGWGTGFGSAFSFLGSLHILVFLVALALAIAIVVISRMDALMPGWVVELWPSRAGILAAAIFISLVFFFLERLVGFGLESSVSPADFPTLHRTFWVCLAFWVQVIALLGALLEMWLEMRKSKPVPRIDVSW
jgi:zinc-ribbon domain